MDRDELLLYADRVRMVEEQLAERGIRAGWVLEGMGRLRRELFLPEELAGRAYDDRAFPIGREQTISQPYITARMAEALGPLPTDRVLEIGTGSGYSAALTCMRAFHVYTVERIEELSSGARRRLSSLGFHNITFHTGDGSVGLGRYAPFDRIVVTAAAPEPPPSLMAQLRIGGRLIIPVGSRSHQDLICLERRPGGWKERFVCACVFVPLCGAEGWP